MKPAHHMEGADSQSVVDAYFSKNADYWNQTYTGQAVQDAIYQQRLAAALAMAEQLQILPDARVLDIGCGAGLAAVSLAQAGASVEAVDSVQAMIDATRRRASEAGVQARLGARVADVHALPFGERTFDLVVALGLLPWVPHPEEPLREMSRVLKPGGHIIVSIDTRWQLREAFDPYRNPIAVGPRKLAGDVLRRLGVRRPRSDDFRHFPTSPRAFRRLLHRTGFEELHGLALGFGPFTFCGRELLPNALGRKLNSRLASLAERNTPFIRSAGSQYLTLARKQTEVSASC